MSNDRAVLESRKEGKQFLDLVAKRISQPDLASELIAAAARLVVAAASANGKENTPVAAAAVAAPSDASMLVKFPGMSLNNPRGKFDIGFSPEALVLSNAKSSVVVPVATIMHVAILDQIPQDTKKRCLLFVVLDRNGPPVMNGKQRLEAVIIQTLETEMLKATTAAGDALDGPAAAVLCEALALAKPGFQEFIAPDPELFKTAKGHVGVSAYVKASAGHLFPLRGGLLFAERPPIFLPLADVLAVEYRRPQSATFDLVLHVRPRDGASSASSSSSAAVQQLEFSQVDKAELGRLQSYFSACKVKPYDPAAPPRLDGGGGSGGAGGGAAGGAGAAGAGGGDADEDDDEDESDADDEDFDPSELQRLESGRAAKRQRTGASGSGAGPSTSKAAAEGAANDDDDDNEDEEAEADGESEEESEEDEDEDSYDEDEELADLTDEDDMAAEVVRRAAKRGGGQAAGGGQEEEEDDDDDDDDDEEEEDD
ncbi:hypothetical protein HYH02_015026 [Chlamydomonas schloesseri]|uniref:FACT complex subunit SSRP1 n=1 Tax=Chlamydomonas schloesseri TaxID=2026947 RepID=A0A835SNH8_9CHLO|nr:hypothetical protein HYH02_015026 [Chlamydomonas schloesseri]|eukprot:KAG2425419.1 hypothetical protein HYH02_015026 [Chlamydomonas schloesseri]